ncbi:hypothetical protein [Algoriphagus zhangzhouensis]|uniref:SnoaL-like domain-containing protein n=1 Tax=Algoriphagus zhangzhouensis TaxID=1073327 RepID=A0A1M7Z7E5_9BACT|nr:hypothetical protein [Algoriphagus zhangzhouensis]TDY49358.1 hypothetical protein A8938_1051 [Algoriphagus zhangzhouensis]SHO60821.1 hypothetical protein SAMN04488108_1051 [Algoriphagus zhangzhouensis]
MKTNIPSDCGNSPKNKLIADLTIAFVGYELNKVEPFLDEDIQWTLVGDITIDGKKEFLESLSQMISNPASELEIFQIVTHGKSAAVNGKMKMKDGSQYGFADFYIFSSASFKKVKSITSYVQAI